MTNTMHICCNKDLMNMKLRNIDKFSGYDYSPDAYFKGFRPKTDISEDSNNIYFEFELPGIEPDSIKVVINKENILSISAEKINPVQNARKIHVRERFFGHFERNFQLNENIKSDKISASYDFGVLKVIVPKKIPEERFIEIK